MENKTFAYVRVSSKEQNLSRQIDSMLQYVKDPRDIYCDKQSGKNFERPGYQALFYNLRSGDELYIHTLSRLGRNKTETKNQLIELQKKGVLVRVLDIPTTLMDFSAFGSLQRSIMEMVNNILIEVLSTIAEVERDNIRTAQKEGIQSAKSAAYTLDVHLHRIRIPGLQITMHGKMISVAQYPLSGNITFLPARFTALYGVGKNHKKSTKLYYYNLVDFSFAFIFQYCYLKLLAFRVA